MLDVEDSVLLEELLELSVEDSVLVDEELSSEELVEVSVEVELLVEVLEEELDEELSLEDSPEEFPPLSHPERAAVRTIAARAADMSFFMMIFPFILDRYSLCKNCNPLCNKLLG